MVEQRFTKFLSVSQKNKWAMYCSKHEECPQLFYLDCTVAVFNSINAMSFKLFDGTKLPLITRIMHCSSLEKVYQFSFTPVTPLN